MERSRLDYIRRAENNAQPLRSIENHPLLWLKYFSMPYITREIDRVDSPDLRLQESQLSIRVSVTHSAQLPNSATQIGPPPNLSTIPPEIQLQVLENLEWDDLLNLRQVCMAGLIP